MLIEKHCQTCGKDEKFTLKYYSKKDGRPVTARFCDRCKRAHYKKGSYSDKGGYSRCAPCNRIAECRQSVRAGGSCLCDEDSSIEMHGRARWTHLEKQLKRLGWDKLPAMGD